MGRQRRLNWIADGRPFRLMTPAAALRDVLRGHGYTVYDIGNEDHLEHDPPEDHTPYSATGFPGDATYGVGYAEDIMPPRPGQLSKVDGLPLPSLQQLGAQLLADRKAGEPGIRWLKYMNWEPERDNSGPCYHESWEPTYARRSSGDRGHIHLSGLTGFESSTIAAGYDPVARIRGEDDMPSADEIVAALLGADLNYTGSGAKTLPLRTLLRNLHQQQHGPSFPDWQATKESAAVRAQLTAFGAAVAAEGTNPAELAAALAALPQPDDIDEQAIVSGVLAGLGARPAADVARALQAAGLNVAALRDELAKLDASPQS